MKSDFQTWGPHPLLETIHELRFTITHAYYGQIPGFQGSDTLVQNRFYFCIEDCGEISWCLKDGKSATLALPKGSLTFIPPNLNLTYNFKQGTMTAFHFNLAIFPGLDIFEKEDSCYQSLDELSICNKIYQALKGEDNLQNAMYVNSLLLQSASNFCDDLDGMQQQIKLRKKYAELLDLIDKHLDAQLGVGELADLLSLSRDQLSKRFRRDIGIPLKHYLNKRIVNKASHLLSTGMNVRETAIELCFSSEFYFSRFFSTQTGLSPSDFRKQYKN